MATALAADAPRLRALSTAVPANVLEQEAVEQAAARLFATDPRSRAVFERLRPVYRNAGIRRRYSVAPLSWFERDHGLADRNDLYLEAALDLIEGAARRCLDMAGTEAGRIDDIVTVSTTGIATPSLEARLMQRLAIRPDVRRTPLFGLGCAGGVTGLMRAATLARARPGAVVLVLVVELCTLTFRRADLSKNNLVATALFGDGAAAALIQCGRGGGDDWAAAHAPRLLDAAEHTWPGTLDIMGWDIRDDGYGVLFSRDIPQLVRDRFGAVVEGFLRHGGWAGGVLDHLLAHPGGVKVLDAFQDVLGLSDAALADSRAILADYGNMSAATALFVLQRAIGRGALAPGGEQRPGAWFYRQPRPDRGRAMTLAYIVLALVALQRLAELRLSARNTRRLRRQGAVEHGGGHYPLFVALHGAWLLAMAANVGPATSIAWWWLALFTALQAGRVWVIASLGRYWTTRILTLEGAPLVRSGPYRWTRHPNYLVVALELAVLPLALGMPEIAVAATLANLPLTAWRIRREDAALSSRRLALSGHARTREEQ